MEGNITAEDEEHIGLDIIDNVGNTHDLTLEKSSGEIVYHQCDAYHDEAVKRSPENNEHSNQAARYARYYVYREEGHDTLPSHENPDRIATLALLIDAMDTDTFASHFGDFYEQIRAHHTDAAPPRALPEEIDLDDVLFYRQNVYLGLDEEDVGTLAELFARDSMQALFERAGELSDSQAEDAEARLEEVARAIDDDVPDDTLPRDLLLDAVSGIHVRWDSGLQEHIERGEEPREREADVRLEMFPLAYQSASIEEFKDQVVHHLKCQIRDCYVGMGVEPPEAVKTTGPGIYKYSNWYEHHDVYQAYHDPDADIDWSVRGPLPTA